MKLLAALLLAANLGAADEDAMFGAEASSTPAPEMAQDKSESSQKLAIGGVLSSTFNYQFFEGRSTRDNLLSNPNQVFFYADSQLAEDVRVLVRAKLFHDPTWPAASAPPGLTGTSEVKASLEEMKLSFNLKNKAFITAGRQKIKHGSGRFFNPTDFLNAVPRNIFLRSDERPGVDLFRLHVPLGGANLYAAAQIGTTAAQAEPGAYGRLELPHNGLGEGAWVGGGELSLSALSRPGQASRFGFDLSQSLWDFDAILEVAAYRDTKDEWQAPHSVGLSYDIRYADRGSNVLTLQAEFLEAGNFGRSAVFVALLPSPGPLQHWTFLALTLHDFPTQTSLSRVDAIWALTPQLRLTHYASVRWGVPGGNLRRFYDLGDAGLRLDVNF